MTIALRTATIRGAGIVPDSGNRMAEGFGVRKVDGEGISPIPTLALRGGISGVFVDFDLLPALFASINRSKARRVIVARWARLLDKHGFEDRHIDSDDHPVAQPESTLAAEGAWRLAEYMGFITAGALMDTGRQVAEFAGLDAATRQELLAPILAAAVEGALVGQGGAPILPLLRQAAQTLAESENLWVRECPGLLPVEVGAIVHWACVDLQRAHTLVRDIEINRDIAMHRVGPPNRRARAGANAERHFERVSEFYLEHSDLRERVPLTFGEELALVRLIGYCGLLREVAKAGLLWLV